MSEVFKCAYTEIVPLSKLVSNPKNPNNHPKKQIELLAKIIDYQGQRSPIVVSKRSGFVTKGHGRLAAITSLSWKNAAVDYQDYDSEAQEYADMIADNKIAELAEHDDAKMILDIPGIPDLNLEMLGMIDFKMPEVFEPQSDEDSVPEFVEPKAKLGDIYQLGDHRLMCGDSTSIDAVEKLMDGQKADMVFTDPPYGVSYAGGHNEKKRKGIQGDTLEGQSLSDLFGASLSCAEIVSAEHAAFYIWYANGKAVETFSSFASLSLKVRAVICWYKVKSGLGAFMSQYIPNHEPCIYAYKDGCSPQWFGPTDEKTVWELKKEQKNEFHPTQKPIELPERAINNSSKNGDIVLDLFGGSGSTLIACEKTNRKCFMMELDPHYIDVIVARWEKYTGKIATLLGQDV
jgi:DNA modification methylase